MELQSPLVNINKREAGREEKRKVREINNTVKHLKSLSPVGFLYEYKIIVIM